MPTSITLTPLLPVQDPITFAEQLVATGVEHFVVQQFHTDRGRFVAGTREAAVRLREGDGLGRRGLSLDREDTSGSPRPAARGQRGIRSRVNQQKLIDALTAMRPEIEDVLWRALTPLSVEVAQSSDYERQSSFRDLLALSHGEDAMYDRPTVGVMYALWYQAKRMHDAARALGPSLLKVATTTSFSSTWGLVPARLGGHALPSSRLVIASASRPGRFASLRRNRPCRCSRPARGSGMFCRVMHWLRTPMFHSKLI